MAKNKKYWKTLLASSSDKKHAAQTGEDPLEEGLKQLTWFESSKQAVRRGINKTYETFGEEVGNSVTSGVAVLYLLGLLPFAAINTYLRVSAENSASQAHVIMSVIAISAFIITLILALLMSTVYHLMKHGTPHKRVMNKVNRSVAYFATHLSASTCLAPSQAQSSGLWKQLVQSQASSLPHLLITQRSARDSLISSMH